MCIWFCLRHFLPSISFFQSRMISFFFFRFDFVSALRTCCLSSFPFLDMNLQCVIVELTIVFCKPTNSEQNEIRLESFHFSQHANQTLCPLYVAFSPPHHPTLPHTRRVSFFTFGFGLSVWHSPCQWMKSCHILSNILSINNSCSHCM